MPHQGGPDGNIVNAIEKMERTLSDKIDGLGDKIDRQGEKIDDLTEAVRQLVQINAGMLEWMQQGQVHYVRPMADSGDVHQISQS